LVVAYFSPVNIVMAEQMTPEEIQRVFDAYNDELLRTGRVTKETADAFADAKTGIRNYTFQLNQSLKSLGQASLDLAGAMNKGEQGASVYNNSLKAGADAIDAFAAKFGILGRIIGGLITAGAKYVIAVNEQSDKLFASYQQLSRVGAAGASGMTGVFKSMQDFGYNIEQLGEFGNLIKANSESLAMFGTNVSAGTKGLADVAKGIQRTGLQTQFLTLGMTVDQINQGIAGYIAINSRLGLTQTKTTKELENGAAAYLKQQDLLTKLTGKNAETIENEEKARQSDQQYRAIMRDLSKREQAGDVAAGEKINQIRIAMAQLGPEGKKALQQAMTGFAGAGKEGEKLLRTSARGFSYASDPLFKASTYLQTITEDGAQRMDQFGNGLAKLGLYNDVFTDFAESADSETLSMTKSYAQREKEAKDALDNQITGAEGAIKAQVGMRQEQMEATRALQTFVNQGVNRTTAAMSKLSGAIETVVSKIPGTGPDTGTTGTGRGNVSSLLDIIGRGESGGNYNALVGGGSANLTSMTIAEVQQLQSTMIKSGRPSTAVGKYQMIAATLAEQAKKAGLDPNTTRFDQQTQDLLASQLVGQAGYGSKDPATVMKNLAGTFASLPQDMSGRGRYDGYNTNKANINPNDLMSAIQSVPRDSYSSALRGVDPGTVRTNTAGTETAAAISNARNSNDLIVIQISKMDELIGLMKTNNTINSKILQRSRN
jgi:muramidase (phage lysozyme)